MMSINRRLLTFITLLTANTAQAATLTATNANEFNAAVKAAQGGDTIVLNGTFGLSYIKNKAWTSTVTLDATNATFTDSLAITKTDNLTVIGGHYGSRSTSTAYLRAIYVNVGSNIKIVNPDVVGNFGGSGIGISSVTNASVTGGTFNGLKVGVGFVTVNNGSITNNNVTGSVSDGFNIADSRNVKISFNNCTDGTPLVGAHPDCVQLWSFAGGDPQSNIEISDNYAFGLTQGFTSFDQDQNSLVDSLITRNTIIGYFPQGIACYGCFNTTISNNTLITLPGAPHWVNLNIINGGNNTVTNNSRTGYNKALAQVVTYYTLDQLTGVAPPPTASSATTVPEPATWSLFIIGFGAIGALRRRIVAHDQRAMRIPS